MCSFTVLFKEFVMIPLKLTAWLHGNLTVVKRSQTQNVSSWFVDMKFYLLLDKF